MIILVRNEEKRFREITKNFQEVGAKIYVENFFKPTTEHQDESLGQTAMPDRFSVTHNPIFNVFRGLEKCSARKQDYKMICSARNQAFV